MTLPLAQRQAIKASAQPGLLARATVEAVGLGPKETNNVRTGEQALIVFVWSKKPLEDLPPAQRIPPAIQGLKTDVVECGHTHPQISDAVLEGGMAAMRRDLGCGTIGCLAWTTDSEPREVLLTNAHVLLGYPPIVKKEGDDFYYPRPALEWSSCCSNAIATGMPGRWRLGSLSNPSDVPLLDAAIALLKAGVRWKAEITGMGDAPGSSMVVKGTHTLTEAEITENRYVVAKYGNTTKQTTGYVRAFDATVKWGLTKAPEVPELHRQLVIQNMNAGRSMSAKGDSGSVVVNADREVVGLLWGGSGLVGYANPIDEVEKQLKITIATASSPGIINTVSEGPKALAMRIGAMTAADYTLAGGVGLLSRPRPRLFETGPGRKYLELFGTHRDEVLGLINTNRRVAVVWHRSGGPGILRALGEGAVAPERPLPTVVVPGIPLADSVERILAVLTTHGSPALRRDVERFREPLRRLGGRSYAEILAEPARRRPPTRRPTRAANTRRRRMARTRSRRIG
jgi:hypothetical protein